MNRERKPWTPRKTESDRHRELVAELLRAGASSHGFRCAVEAAVGCEFVEAPRIIPDAYGINASEQRVFVYEVCVAHWITRKKRAALRAWRGWLEPHGWSIRLLKVTAGGMVGIDLDSGELDAESVASVAARLGRRSGP